ncbi:hypothetical protein EV202_10918 [Bacteroides heparinolyticus]|uniref:Uncharacterized protein n=1 Tax=Prevotella heparinolytica TaxID=28113 RepID=A0A4R2LST8_9BACE|nr:hypothetical protein EV202_10918 [Bacteroides heparinolyticus]
MGHGTIWEINTTRLIGELMTTMWPVPLTSSPHQYY